MEQYRNFSIASYMFAYYVATATDDDIRRGVEKYLANLPLKKVYVENHRGTTDVPVERLREVKALLEGYGIQVSGGITSTVLLGGVQKPALYDTFCYTDPAHRAEYLRIVREIAEVFDEIILDDFFFTSCRCEMCIAAKGRRSWKDFRQSQMEEFSREIVAEARRVNPNMNFIIKYPNWYESYHETGYNPDLQKHVFDMVYTGTETREPFYSQQHLQRYESYSLVRLMENTAPGRNGGGWIDLGGSSDNMNRWLEQMEFTLLGGARELTMFNFPSLVDSPAMPAMDEVLRRVDAFLDKAGKPTGLKVYEPFDADGEDQLCNYLGMCGLPLELTNEFPEDAPAVLLTQRSACAPGIMEKLEAYVRGGGRAIVTTGFVHETAECGIKDMTSVRLTHRHALGCEYMIDRTDYSYESLCYARSPEKVMIEALDYKTNATWADILLLAGEDNFPLLTEDFYGKGRLLILNAPENFAELYKLPGEVVGVINAELSRGEYVYLASEPKLSLIAYDNGVFCVHSFKPMRTRARVVVRGECAGIKNLVNGRVYTDPVRLPAPAKRGDAALARTAEQEYAFDIGIGAGESMYLEVLRQI